MVAGSESPDPQGPGPSDPSQGWTSQFSCSAGSLLTSPAARPHPAWSSRRPAEPEPPRDQTGCRGAGKVSPRGGGRAPQVRGRRPLAPARWSPCSHICSPFPPGGLGPAGGPILVASEHLPDTWRDAAPHPPPPLRTSGDQPLSPKARPGSGPLLPPGTSPWGAVASAPRRLHSRLNPSDRDRWKQKSNAGR